MANVQTETNKGAKRKLGGTKKAEAKVRSAAKREVAIIPTVSAGALSTDIGPRFLGLLTESIRNEAKADALYAAADEKGYEALTIMTGAIVKAAQADSSINLLAVLSQEDNAAKQVKTLNDQIRIATGIMQTVTVKGAEGKPDMKRLAYTKAADAIMQKMTKTQQTNVAHMMKKCAKAAIAIIENKMTFKPEGTTLMLGGPAVKKFFGQESVKLDEKQTIQLGKDDKGKPVTKELLIKPSFTALATIASEAHGIVMAARGGNHAGRVDSRKVPVTGATDDSFIALCTALVNAMNKLTAGSGLSDKMYRALDPVKSAISQADKARPQ